jgi:hypothetical protein
MLDIRRWILEEEEGMITIPSSIKYQASSICDFKVLLPENRSLI